MLLPCGQKLRIVWNVVQRLFRNLYDWYSLLSLILFWEWVSSSACRNHTKWCNEEPGFAEYFIDQWDTENSFNSWRIFCSASGVASTNNALESFNKTIKKNFTLGSHHLLPALFDIIMERLLLNFSLDIIMERKIF